MPDKSIIADDLPLSIEWKDGELYILDQTLLPHKTVMEHHTNAEQVWDTIKRLKVRGAPAIGVSAAYGLCVEMRHHVNLSSDEFIQKVKEQADYLDSSRPTAINLNWAMKRMVECLDQNISGSNDEMLNALIREAELIHEEDKAISYGLAKVAEPLIKDGMGIMTHCNAGSLATSILGTATAPMYLAHDKGKNFKVYANETRPLFQGARLTAWELDKAGIDVTLITDNMAAHMMATGQINMVIVGTDRVVANGDVANKIGTLGVAILAKHYGIPFYVACPSSTIDMHTATGADIPIEERDGAEVTTILGQDVAAIGTKTRSPAFDVTPNELVTGIFTEKGMITAPYKDALEQLMKGA
ncbi:S-methyl-5-thioribose-1-phosphate isomerase [Pseudemcibacter aquimaris]|uniref:S-methyl-5-thioribose-1-phosphate isomerase n=1 Tax=Pseudemcibacter aquimaris TaxID=2857064 RepID=UPI0020115676|nr:S-methyl-5-thioribose-1-phosphate isomerase [Pseudemcibacter aquimaris]MCC3860228.1 S-methyl-5-thioribose-1-phosphate isomerase [Pseudemcibacter aquimaris]WDU57553.1 S-methyl-5-thioribose-1-phosphate isomerase [Pseudemcibacter aquimaris]